METKDNEIFEMPGGKRDFKFLLSEGNQSRIWMKSKKSLQNLDNKVCKADESASNMEEKKYERKCSEKKWRLWKRTTEMLQMKILMDQKSKNTVEKVLSTA